MPLVSTDAELREANDESLRARIGGKGLGLIRLLELGLNVPRFCVVETEGYRADGDVSGALRKALGGALETLGPGPLAVRSSAVAEDGAVASFAGQLESVLGVEGLDAVVDAVQQCWRSGDSERVRAYRAHHGLEASPVAVVIQRFIDADAAGVSFTTDPQDPDTALVSAAWGLGEGVVQGQVPCDTWHVGIDGAMHAQLATKDAAIRMEGGRLQERVVEGDASVRPCLSDDVLERLVHEGRRLEAELGGAQDIEFAVHAGELYFLQVRPVTVPIPRGKRLLWDNSNIVESFSGPTTPMTFSFASKAYGIIYQLFSRVMGVDERTIRMHSSTFGRMIGLIRGRVYYNLNAWYLVVSLLPGFQFNRHFMEQMMGVSEVAEDTDALAESGWKKTFVHGPRALWMGLKLGWRYFRLDADVAHFRRVFKETYRRWRRTDVRGLSAFELVDAYADLERNLLWAWTPPIVNDFFVMVFYGVLRKLAQRMTGDDDTNLHNELLAGEGGLESTAPTVEALHLAAWVRKRPALHHAFLETTDDDAAWTVLQSDETLARNLADYIRAYGDRCVDELKLETVSPRQQPVLLVPTFRNYLTGDAVDPTHFGQAERRMRQEAEARAASLAGGLRALLFRWVLRNARARVKERENLRFARTRIFGLARDLIRALGARLVESGQLDVIDDVFWLHIDELLSFVQGTTVTTDLRGLVVHRRAEFATYRELPAPPERFYTWGPVHVNNVFPTRTAAPAPSDGRLQGLGCYPGVVEGAARVVHDPATAGVLDGQILVAVRTDPGWVPLFPRVSGLLVERGSLLSHSAVVAREMGIPTIVGLRGVTEWVQDGQRVRMDGSAGTVERVPE